MSQILLARCLQFYGACAMASISTSAFLGSVLTAKHARAGGGMPSNDLPACRPTCLW